MAQIMVDNFKKSRIKQKMRTRDTQTQTGDPFEYFFNLNDFKHVRVYYSESYKDYVLSINFGKCKKYIITRKMWYIFQLHYSILDNIFNSTETLKKYSANYYKLLNKNLLGKSLVHNNTFKNHEKI